MSVIRERGNDKKERTASVFTRLVCVSGDGELSEALPRSISINKSSVGG